MQIRADWRTSLQIAHLVLQLVDGFDSVVALLDHVIELALESVAPATGLAKLIPQILRLYAISTVRHLHQHQHGVQVLDLGCA